MTLPFIVNSFGGCGSKFLVKQIVDFQNYPQPYGRYHGHYRRPQDCPQPVDKLLFIYCQPEEAICSFFARRHEITSLHGYISDTADGLKSWVKLHCGNIRGDVDSFSEDWDLSDFLDQGQDYLRIQDFVSQWLDGPIKQEICFIRYETMWENVDKIADFLGVGADFISGFIPKKERKNHQHWVRPDDYARLKALYQPVSDVLDELPDVMIRTV